MKKFFLVAILVAVCCAFCGCKNNSSMFPYVSEVRKNILYGEKDGYGIKAFLYESEVPKTDDGKVNGRLPFIEFNLTCDASDVVYTLSFSLNGKKYSDRFEINPLSGILSLDVEVDGINFSALTVTLSVADEHTEIKLKSIVPKNVLSPAAALEKVYKNNVSLFNAFDVGDKFAAEIRIKIITAALENEITDVGIFKPGAPLNPALTVVVIVVPRELVIAVWREITIKVTIFVR